MNRKSRKSALAHEFNKIRLPDEISTPYYFKIIIHHHSLFFVSSNYFQSQLFLRYQYIISIVVNDKINVVFNLYFMFTRTRTTGIKRFKRYNFFFHKRRVMCWTRSNAIHTLMHVL